MKTFSIILFLLFSISASSQNKDSINVDIIKKKMPLCYTRILENAKQKWNADYSMQSFEVKKQSLALKDFLNFTDGIKGVPQDVQDRIEVGALRKWSKNDILNCIQSNSGNPYDDVAACFDADWSMVVFEIEKQVKAYISLTE